MKLSPLSSQPLTPPTTPQGPKIKASRLEEQGFSSLAIRPCIPQLPVWHVAFRSTLPPRRDVLLKQRVQHWPFKLDTRNGERWTAYHERLSRWQARQTSQIPPKLRIVYDVLKGDVIGEKLACLIGILSDSAVHFTPEYLSSLDFQERSHGTVVFSDYLEADEDQIAQDVKMLAAVHLLILKTIDKCCGGICGTSQRFPVALLRLSEAARGLYANYPFTLRPEFEVEFETQPGLAG
jgi:hypothetical protein